MSLIGEETLTFKEAAKLIRVDLSSIYRWARKGTQGGVILESYRVGGGLRTTREALERFVEAQAESPQEDAEALEAHAQRVDLAMRRARELTRRGRSRRAAP